MNKSAFHALSCSCSKQENRQTFKWKNLPTSWLTLATYDPTNDEYWHKNRTAILTKKLWQVPMQKKLSNKRMSKYINRSHRFIYNVRFPKILKWWPSRFYSGFLKKRWFTSNRFCTDTINWMQILALNFQKQMPALKILCLNRSVKIKVYHSVLQFFAHKLWGLSCLNSTCAKSSSDQLYFIKSDISKNIFPLKVTITIVIKVKDVFFTSKPLF